MQPSVNEAKLCIDCKYLSEGGFGLCESPRNGFSVVDGKPKSVLARVSRADKVISLKDYSRLESCGPEGRFFEPKPSKKCINIFKRLIAFLYKK